MRVLFVRPALAVPLARTLHSRGVGEESTMPFKTSFATGLAFVCGSLIALGAVCAGGGGVYPDNVDAPGGYPGGPYAEGGYSGGGYAGGGYSGGAYAGGGYAGGGYAVGSYPGGAYPGGESNPPPASRREVDGRDRRIQQREQRDQWQDRQGRVRDRRHDQLERREEERTKREERRREPRVHLRARERFDDRVQRRAREATPLMRAPRPHESQTPRHNENSRERRGYSPGDRPD